MRHHPSDFRTLKAKEVERLKCHSNRNQRNSQVAHVTSSLHFVIGSISTIFSTVAEGRGGSAISALYHVQL